MEYYQKSKSSNLAKAALANATANQPDETQQQKRSEAEQRNDAALFAPWGHRWRVLIIHKTTSSEKTSLPIMNLNFDGLSLMLI
jgi:hypothetical protein